MVSWFDLFFVYTCPEHFPHSNQLQRLSHMENKWSKTYEYVNSTHWFFLSVLLRWHVTNNNFSRTYEVKLPLLKAYFHISFKISRIHHESQSYDLEHWILLVPWLSYWLVESSLCRPKVFPWIDCTIEGKWFSVHGQSTWSPLDTNTVWIPVNAFLCT